MSKVKMHYDATPPGSAIPQSLCGDITARVTDEVASVTCKLCRRRLAKAFAVAAAPAVDHVERYVEDVFAGRVRAAAAHEDLDGLPVLTPATYARRDCACGECSVCRYFRAVRQIDYIAPWADSRPRVSTRTTRFSSVTHALEVYVIGREDGASAGGWGCQLDIFRTLGVRVQADGETSSRAERMADDVIEVERALTVAFDAANDRGLGLEACVAILLARVVGRLEVVESAYGRRSLRHVPVPAECLAERFGVSTNAIGGIVKSGRARVQEYLCRKGLVPARRSKMEAA